MPSNKWENNWTSQGVSALKKGNYKQQRQILTKNPRELVGFFPWGATVPSVRMLFSWNNWQ